MTLKIEVIGDKALIKFDYDSFESLGSNSLTGCLANYCTENKMDFSKIKEVILSFREATRKELEDNKGPEDIIMPAYVPGLLMKNILWFISEGIKVEVDFYKKI